MLTQGFTTVSGGSMGKPPVLRIGDLVLQESGTITQSLMEKYDTLHYLFPTSGDRRAKVQTRTYMLPKAPSWPMGT